MVRLLLGVDEVQVPLSSWLLEKLAIVSFDFEDDDNFRAASNSAKSKLSLPQLILSQLRWLDRSVSREHLVDKILEILEGSSFFFVWGLVAGTLAVDSITKHQMSQNH